MDNADLGPLDHTLPPSEGPVHVFHTFVRFLIRGLCYLFISLDGACSDQQWDPDNERFTTDPNQSGTSYIWLKKSTEFARSEEACQSEMQASKYLVS